MSAHTGDQWLDIRPSRSHRQRFFGVHPWRLDGPRQVGPTPTLTSSLAEEHPECLGNILNGHPTRAAGTHVGKVHINIRGLEVSEWPLEGTVPQQEAFHTATPTVDGRLSQAPFALHPAAKRIGLRRVR
jgi:hypothetical protein